MRVRGRHLARRLALGVVAAAIVVGVMAVPVPFAGGVVFDTRSVPLALTGAFFGALPTAVAALAAAGFRLTQGGAGAWPGVLVIAVSGLLGLGWRRWRRGRLASATWWQLYAFGWAVHVAMLVALMATLPREFAGVLLRVIAAPVLLIYPVATAAVGWLLVRRLRAERLAGEVRGSEERLRRAIEASPIPVMLHADDGTVLELSDAWSEMSGHARADLGSVEAWVARAFGGDAAAARDETARPFGQAGRIDLGDRTVRRPDGGARTWAFGAARIGALADGRALAVVTATDVTERREAEDARRLAVLVYDNAAEAMLVTDAQDRIMTVNRAFCEITGYVAADVIGHDPLAYRAPLHDEVFFVERDRSLRESGVWRGETWMARKSGGPVAVRLSISTILDDAGAPFRRVMHFSDVTDERLADERIWRQANFDMLTGLPNRHMFRERLGRELERARRDGSVVAVLLFDIDRFKEVNDTLGHDQGDALLAQIAARVVAQVRATDLVARLGGDEFVVALTHADDRLGMERALEMILRATSEPVTLREDTVFVSASVGVTLFPHDADTFEGLMKNADQALYAAKDAGRNRWSYFSPELQRTADERRLLVRDLRQAVAQDQLHLAFQPIVDLATGTVHAGEALLRWQHPTRGLVPPNVFVPIAEDSGLIVEIGEWVLGRALSTVARWRTQFDAGFQVSVNVSPVQFAAPRAWTWHERLSDHALTGDALAVEITEGLLLRPQPSVAAHLEEMRRAGIEVALDDFGTGYSSLAYLKRLDIDYLKIDRSFVRDLSEDPDDVALCEAIIVMAHRLGLRVVAEGIETVAQRDVLLAAGCDFGQGYWFARPLGEAAFEAWVGWSNLKPA